MIFTKKILIGECKWSEKENASRLFYELENKARMLPFVKDKEIGRADITAACDVSRLGYADILNRLIKSWFLK